MGRDTGLGIGRVVGSGSLGGVGRLFGTDGVRGVVGSELTAELAGAIGAAAAEILGRGGPDRPRLVVGRDPRSSGAWLEDALVEGVVDSGGDALLAGIEPTPAVAFLTVDLGATAGVVISASHNPPEYNGIKLFGADGMKLPDEVEDRIEAEIGKERATRERGSVSRIDAEARERYLDHLVAAAETKLDGLAIVVDCANGAASEVAPELYRRLGATVHAINDSPDGENINAGCGALHPEVVAAEVVRLGADAGIAHDGDADRSLFADAAGAIVDGDQVLAACAIAMRDAGRLPHDAVVTTVMANLGFTVAMRDAGIRVHQTAVGDRYVLEEMVRSGASLGGEQSGHLIFLDDATTGDGLLTAVRFLSLATSTGRSVADLAAVMRRYPQVIVNVPVGDRTALDESTPVWDAVSAVEEALGGRGRVLVRASGTEHLVRVMAEAETEQEAREHAEAVAAVVQDHLGSPAASAPAPDPPEAT
jgi:phosphoglucosamine mutase